MIEIVNSIYHIEIQKAHVNSGKQAAIISSKNLKATSKPTFSSSKQYQQASSCKQEAKTSNKRQATTNATNATWPKVNDGLGPAYGILLVSTVRVSAIPVCGNFPLSLLLCSLKQRFRIAAPIYGRAVVGWLACLETRRGSSKAQRKGDIIHSRCRSAPNVVWIGNPGLGTFIHFLGAAFTQALFTVCGFRQKLHNLLHPTRTQFMAFAGKCFHRAMLELCYLVFGEK